jgi:hypothetical protein
MIRKVSKNILSHGKRSLNSDKEESEMVGE